MSAARNQDAALTALGQPTRFIVFERDPYAWYFSVWLQAVKRDGCPDWLDTALAGHEEGFLRPLLVPALLEAAAAGSGGLLTTLRLDYDACRRDAAGAFFAALDLPAPATDGQPARCNRSVPASSPIRRQRDRRRVRHCRARPARE